MNAGSRQLLLDLVRDFSAEDPSLVSDVIDAAITGVKQFARGQRDSRAEIAARLLCVLEQIPAPEIRRFGSFSAEEVLDSLNQSIPWYTKGYNERKRRETHTVEEGIGVFAGSI